MIIKKMTASFGCLENAELELHEGLNVITAPNESGKSTWCGFLKAMLYGIDSSRREKGGVKPDKVKFAPWSGKAMSGEMEIEHEGRGITLRRSTKAQNAPMREFSAVYTGTADPVPGMKGTDVGPGLTGMPKAVFESSVFVGQSGISVANSPELEKRINAIISTGSDESISYSDADERLRAWQRKRRHNRSGAIPTLDGEIAAKSAALDGMQEAAARRGQLQLMLEAALEGESLACRLAEKEEEMRRAAEIEALESLRERKTAAEEAYLQAREKAAAALLETGKGPFPGKTAEEARVQAEADARRLGELRSEIPSPVTSTIILVLSVAAVLIGYFLDGIVAVILGVGGLPLLLAGGISFYMINAKKKEVNEASADILKLYGCKTPEAILAKAEEYKGIYAGYEEAKAAQDSAEEEMEALRARLKEAEKNFGIRTSGETAAEAQARAKTADIRRRIDQNEGMLQAMGDPMVTSTELDALRTRREELGEEYEALALAIDTLREANDELQQRFAPALGRRAAEIMSRLTGGKYTELAFDRSLDATAKREGDTVAHEKSFLSEGTADQLYLALRLAICELALPEGKSCPLVLDDALVNFDDERMGCALELLKDIAKERQVILFSCHDREKKYLENLC